MAQVEPVDGGESDGRTVDLGQGHGPVQLAEALSDRNAAVKSYAIIGLAGAGDGRAWDLVLERLRVLLHRPSRTLPSEALMAVAYLVQHGMDDQDRLTTLVDILRRSWIA